MNRDTEMALEISKYGAEILDILDELYPDASPNCMVDLVQKAAKEVKEHRASLQRQSVDVDITEITKIIRQGLPADIERETFVDLPRAISKEIYKYLTSQGHLTAVPEGWKLVPVEPTEEKEAHGLSITVKSDDCPLTQFRMMQDDQGDVWASICSPEKGWQSVRLCTMQGGGKNLELRKALAQAIHKAAPQPKEK